MTHDPSQADAQQQPATSLSPLEVEAPALDLELTTSGKGQGRKLVALTVACAVVIAVSVLAVGDLDSRHAFVEAGTHLTKLHKSGYERFWNCALIGMDQSQVDGTDELQTKLDERAHHFGRPYAGLLRKCETSLDALERELGTMQAPGALRPQLRAMRDAVLATRAAAEALGRQVERSGDAYQTAEGSPHLLALATAWQRYREAHLSLRNAIREQL